MVVLVASAGGLWALERVLRDLPPDLPAAIVMMMHLAPLHPSLMAGLLTRSSQRPVREARGGEKLEPHACFVAPPGHHLVFEGGTLQLSQEAPVHHARPSADVLLNSAAVSGRPVVAVVLSGAGRDGAQGVLAVKQAGGRVLAQNPATAAFPSMPASAIEAGGVERVLELEEIGSAVAELVRGMIPHGAH